MNPNSTILFAGGGTGGHLFPGIAAADELRLREPSTRIVFVGSTRSIESTIIAEHGLEHRMLPVEPLPTLKRNPLRFAIKNWQAWREAIRLLRELRPAAVVGLGGYASAPIVWAASRCRIPVILIEQNVIPGRTTRLLSRFADHVCVSFSESISRLPKARHVVVTGNPVRASIAKLYNRNSLEHTEEGPSKIKQRQLLILGGSQGADSLNLAVMAAIKKLADELKTWKIVHQTGPRDAERARSQYQELGLSFVVERFFHDMGELYSSTDIVVSRSGATTLSELACAQTPMILLPYPHAADDHQKANAQAFIEHNAAVLVEHSTPPEGTADKLADALQSLIHDTARRTRMGQAAKELAHPDAAQRFANVIEAAIFPVS
jgi:UDP-N-acetylglucosamine--N-acetylmuramyl-(pentapeptide) pyrophosphoryl-undecaprenol N-acetylglucosamine transferase